MLKIRVGNLWVCNLLNIFTTFLFLFISHVDVQCQIIRKSIELPVKNYLSSPRTSRGNWNGRDLLYTQRDNSDSVRNFDHLPPHTPASALVFSGLVNDFLNAGPTKPTPLFLTPTLVYNVRSGKDYPLTTTSTKATALYNFNTQNNLPFKINLLLPTSSSPTKFLESEQKQSKIEFSLASPTPITKLGSRSTDRKHRLLSTPLPLSNDNNDAVFGYFSKLPASTVTSREDRVDQMVENINDLAQYSNIVPHSEFDSRSYEKDDQHRLTPSRNSYNSLNSFPKHKGSPKYYTKSKPPYYSNPSEEEASQPYSKEITRSRENYRQSGESNYYENSSGRGGTDYSQEQQGPNYDPEQSSEYRGQSNESNDYDSPTDRPLYNHEQKGSAEYYRPSNEYYDYDSQPYSEERPINTTSKQPVGNHELPKGSFSSSLLPSTSQENQNKSNPERNKLPTIRPTIGVIGWKSNKDLETKWRPSSTDHMNIPTEFIRDSSKDSEYNTKVTTTVGPPDKESENEQPSQNQGEDEEEEEEEEGSEEEEEAEDGEEEGEEEEGEEAEDEENEEDEKEPQGHSPKYETSAENHSSPQYPQQYREERTNPHSSNGYYEEEEPLPPGPPYLPPPNLKGDPRTNGYLPFPSLGIKPRNKAEDGNQEPWTPMVPLPTVASQKHDDYKANDKYKSDIDRWLFEGGSVFDFPKEKDFHKGWANFNEGKSKANLEEAESSREYLKSKHKHTGPTNNKPGNFPKNSTESDRIESKDLPVEHRHNHSGNEHTLKERKASRASTKEKPSGTNYRPNALSQDLKEKDERNRVSEHEFRREVPTTVWNPGSGLWAKSKPGTKVDVGFIPKKMYTQTRKYNTETHLPQEAALVDASTTEEKRNAPRLKEVVSHKKVQQVYEEEGYEDSGYDHGGYKKHGQHEAHTVLRHGASQFSSPEIIWGVKTNGGPRPAQFPKKPVEPSDNFKPINSRHKYSSKVQPSIAPYVSFEVEDVSGYAEDRPSKERKSRDLSAFTQDDIGGEVFTRFAAPLREVEHSSSLAGRASERQTTRQPQKEDTSHSGKKYKEIVRSGSQSQEETGENKKDRALRVNVKEELNIRHPFLPRDGNGDVQIDYVQSRTRVEPDLSSSRRKYQYKDDDELPEVTEKPKTTTTTSMTTTKSKSTTTTTEYTPEDPSKVLKRLKSNVFLSSVFPTQENLEDKIDQYVNFPTTTTPKITTYRGNPSSTTEETSSNETPEETLDRLKSNPFLSSVFSSSTQATEETPSQPKRGVRVKHVVVSTRGSDMDSSVKHVEQLTLAQYSGPSHGLMYTSVPTRTKQRIYTLAQHLNDEEIEPMHTVVRRSVSSESDKKQVESKNPSKIATTENPVNATKYPFYYSPASISFPRLSPLRYALNPTNIPNKTSNGMEFYESRHKKIQCYEPTPPTDVAPSRRKDGEWNRSPRPDGQRLGKLGDHIDCLKVKYFGEDPLDNPLFKEETVSIPDFQSPSPRDDLGFYHDVMRNMKSSPESTGTSSSRSNKEKEVNNIFKAGLDHKPFLTYPHKEHSNKSKLTKYIYSSTYRNASKVNNTEASGSELSTHLSLVKNHTGVSTQSTNKSEPRQNIVKLKENLKDSREFPAFPVTQEIQTGFIPIIPVMLHPPKDITVSFKSKGTANHPKIKAAKDIHAPYNMNIKIVPKGQVGYLQSHNPFHIHDLAASMLGGEAKESVTPVFIPDSASSAARAITQVSKQPTTVTYLTINPAGDLLHKHIRTFVPVPSRAPTTISPRTKQNQESKDQLSWWNPLPTDYKWNKPTFRVKRSNENDKYINSKESLELKNYLLQKYKEILSKQTTEASDTSTEKNSSERPLTRTQTSTLRSFPIRHQRPPFSSRYTANSPVMETSSPEGSEEKREPTTQTYASQTNPPIRRPKLRFPKLNMNTKTSSGRDQSKLSNLQEPAPVRTPTTTTTTTTSAPSTTTRMYKPRMVYKKEYGKPLEKVTDIFAVLRRQPVSSTEVFIPEPTTEVLTDPDSAPTNRNRKPVLSGFQRSGERMAFIEKPTRRLVSPRMYNRERSLDVYDHPDLRTPISRSSRNTPEGTYSDMLVYMVNPRTGLGEWKMVPVPSRAISRMDTIPNGNVNSLKNQNYKRTTNRRRRLRPELTFEYYKSTKYSPKDEVVQEANINDRNKENYSTAISGKNWNQTKSKPSISSRKQLITSRERQESTPQIWVPEQTNPYESVSKPINPKIVMEPHKRKYVYVKI